MKWFLSKYETPTDIQLETWTKAKNKENILTIAPTGSGKTMAAFFWAINAFFNNDWETGLTKIVYISPLKALNNDIQRNLIAPLEEIRLFFEDEGQRCPNIRVGTRSGDTSPEERRSTIKYPPEIFVTTPESLHIMLSSSQGEKIFRNVKCVILDEIHSLLDSKRGTALMVSVERLELLCGDLQRIGLSATVNPVSTASMFIAGYDSGMKARAISIVQSALNKDYRLSVDYPDNGIEASHWPAVVNSALSLIRKKDTTLLFTNSRRITEKLTRLINEQAGETVAYSHHGALSRELRYAVEKKMKAGEIKAIVATASLELGIDIGSLDQVVLVQTPWSASSGIQRIGRAGHQLSETAFGHFLPLFKHDLISCAVMVDSVNNGFLEPVHYIENPLDVLAQSILAMCIKNDWHVDDIYGFFRQTAPFHTLKRQHFDLVVDMLCGRYSRLRIKELRPRLRLDGVSGFLSAEKSAAFLLYSSGGTIPDRGHFILRDADNGQKIGELDEEFVWERQIGESFSLGPNIWRIKKISENDVEVVPSKGELNIIPFWRADDMNRSGSISRQMGDFLQMADTALQDGSLVNLLVDHYSFSLSAAAQLEGYLSREKEMLGTLPHRYQIVIEHFDDPNNRGDRKQVVLHTFWGSSLNRPFAMALSGIWQDRFDYPLTTFVNNDCILLLLPHDFSADFFSFITAENVERYLSAVLSSSGYFGSKFREAAGISLLLPKGGFNKRMPLWLNRLRSKKILDAVKQHKDFPAVIEAWRSCIQDSFQLEMLKENLDDIRDGKIKVKECTTSTPSPFADEVIWRQTNTFMYADDTPLPDRGTGLSDNLLKDLLSETDLFSIVPEETRLRLDDLLKRNTEGYAPETAADLLEWVKERLVLTEKEWNIYIDILPEEEKTVLQSGPLTNRISIIRSENGAPFYIAVEHLEDYRYFLGHLASVQILQPKALDGKTLIHIPLPENPMDPAGFFQQWLSFFAGISLTRIPELTGLMKERVTELVLELKERGDLFTHNNDLVIEAYTGEILLRMSRKAREKIIEPLPVDSLSLFLAEWQGIVGEEMISSGLQAVFEKLFGYALAPDLWETAIFPTRMPGYDPHDLDQLLQTAPLQFMGAGKKKILFCLEDEIALFKQYDESDAAHCLPSSSGKYDFFTIQNFKGLSGKDTTEHLWKDFFDGRISNTSFETLRIGLDQRFKWKESSAGRGNTSRAGFSRWQSNRPLSGDWFALDSSARNIDALEEMELQKSRVRILLDRYGILNRALLEREIPSLRWGSLFKAIRLLELSGQLYSGCFFRGLPGLQFISKEGFDLLDHLDENRDSFFWINACDPASLCGLGTPLKDSLPERRTDTWIVFKGSVPVMILQSAGKKIQILESWKTEDCESSFQVFVYLGKYQHRGKKRVVVKEINGKEVSHSEYREYFLNFGFRDNYKDFVYYSPA